MNNSKHIALELTNQSTQALMLGQKKWAVLPLKHNGLSSSLHGLQFVGGTDKNGNKIYEYMWLAKVFSYQSGEEKQRQRKFHIQMTGQFMSTIFVPQADSGTISHD